MGGILALYVLVAIVAVGGIFALIASTVSSGNKFRDSSLSVCEGMTDEDVRTIMGPPSYTMDLPDGSYVYVYEKSEWKGIARGGTQTRRMECVFSSKGILVSVGRNENCYRSGW